jgi:hypothetical protein
MSGNLVESFALRGESMASSDTGSFTITTTGFYYLATYVVSYDYTGGTGTGCVITVGAFQVL